MCVIDENMYYIRLSCLVCTSVNLCVCDLHKEEEREEGFFTLPPLPVHRWTVLVKYLTVPVEKYDLATDPPIYEQPLKNLIYFAKVVNRLLRVMV